MRRSAHQPAKHRIKDDQPRRVHAELPQRDQARQTQCHGPRVNEGRTVNTAVWFKTYDVLSLVWPGVCAAASVALPTRICSPSGSGVNANLTRSCEGINRDLPRQA